jgi:RND superfamily putative drug exporter
MKSFLKSITDRVSTKKGMWFTLGVWVIVTVLLAVFAPSVKEYESSNITSLPSDAKSVIF